MSAQSIRIGMLSFAHGHANSYAACLRAEAGVELVGIYDDNRARGEEAAQRFASHYFTSAEPLLDEALDGVIVCAENRAHRPLVELAAGRTANVLCEKPIATNLADAQAMIDRCAATDTRLQIAFPVRFAPAVQHLKQVVDNGRLGRIFAAKCTNHGSMPGVCEPAAELCGGGAVIDHTVHVIDLLRWIWGAEVVEVYAEIGDSLLHPDLGIDDVGLLSFKLENGIYGTLDTSWSRPPSYPTWGDVKISLVGESGMIEVDAFRQHLSVSSNSLGKTRWAGWGSDMDAGLVRDFIDMIRTGREPSITGRDGLKALEVALAAYRSARLRSPIALPGSSLPDD